MTSGQIQDRIYRGMGTAARVLGTVHDLYRPRGVDDPLHPARRIMRMPASFNPRDPSYGNPGRYGHAVWYGVFDAAYTRAGDYLAGQAGVFFVAAQRPLLPVLCVMTNRTVSVLRPAAPKTAGTNAYGGVVKAAAVPVLGNWPASVLAAGGRQRGDLPSDSTEPSWAVLLPALPAEIRVADVMTDDTGRSFVVASAEESDLGWRLLVRQAEN